MKFDENIKIEEHFQVPEGYFEQFNAEIMDKLPKKKIVMWPRYAAAAAVACVVMISAFTYFYSGNTEQSVKQQVAKTESVTKQTQETKTVEATKQQPVMANVETKKSVKSTAKVVKENDDTDEPAVVTHQPRNSYASYASYDDNEVDRAAQYMGIDDQDVQEMLYTNF